MNVIPALKILDPLKETYSAVAANTNLKLGYRFVLIAAKVMKLLKEMFLFMI